MRLGIVGTDLLHGLEYASIVNAEPSEAFPKVAVDHGAAVGGASEPTVRPRTPPEPILPSGHEVRADPDLGDCRVVAWYADDRPTAAAYAQRVGVPEVVSTPEALIDAVDAVLVCTWHGSAHLADAAPYLEAGLPTFIDKPFTESVADAVQLVELARARDTVVYSASPWKWAPAVTDLLAARDALGGVTTSVATGPGFDGAFFYVTHMVELLQRILGSGVERVTCQDTGILRVITTVYDDGRVGTVNALRDVGFLRHALAIGPNGYLEVEVTERQKEAAMVALLRTFVRAAKRREWLVSGEELIEPVAVMEAAERSHQQGGTPVVLRDLLSATPQEAPR